MAGSDSVGSGHAHVRAFGSAARLPPQAIDRAAPDHPGRAAYLAGAGSSNTRAVFWARSSSSVVVRTS